MPDILSFYMKKEIGKQPELCPSQTIFRKTRIVAFKVFCFVVF